MTANASENVKQPALSSIVDEDENGAAILKKF